VKRGMLSLLVLIFVFSLLPTAALADDGKGKPEKVEKTTGLDRAAEAKAKAEESPLSETELEVAPKPPVVKVPEAPKPKNDKVDEGDVSIPTPVKPGKGEPTLGAPPVLEPDDPVSIWVDINQSHIGTTADCAADWHFVLVGLGKGASPGVLTATFEKAGTIVVDPSKVLQQMQHFDIKLPAGDRLVEAYAQVMLPELSENVRLNLSSVTCVTPPPPPPPPPSEEPTPTPPPKPEKPVTPKPEPKPEYTLVLKPVEEPYLPYTGGNYAIFLGLSTILGSAGLGLRRLGGSF
jgi:hypothetical protein